MTEKEKKPDIRFKGFDDEWEERKLNDIADVRDGTHDSPQYFSEGNPFITSKNVKDGKICYNDIQFISNADFEEINKRSKVDKNDILMGMIGTIGNIALIREIPDFAIKNVALIKDTKSIYYVYLYHFLQSPMVLKQLTEGMDGGTQKFIALNKIRNLSVAAPGSNEQNKIGNYLENLDNLITLKQCKYDKLKNLKKAMLGKMFPKDGADVPEIRFKGFSGAWKKRKYSDSFTNIPSNTFSRCELNYDSGLAKNVHYGDVLIKFGELLDAEKDAIPYITDDSLVNKFKLSKLQNGDVIIADAAEDETVGKCTELINVGEQIVISGLHTIPIRPISLFATGYLGYFMNSPAYHNQLIRLMQGTKVLSISKTAIQDTAIIYPIDIKEQTKISNYFKNLDNLINLHKCELEKLKNIKKACLEKMFV